MKETQKNTFDQMIYLIYYITIQIIYYRNHFISKEESKERKQQFCLNNFRLPTASLESLFEIFSSFGVCLFNQIEILQFFREDFQITNST